MQACPYDALYIDPATHTAAKCHYCAHRVEVGLEPACVVVCPEQAIVAGDLDDPASPDRPARRHRAGPGPQARAGHPPQGLLSRRRRRRPDPVAAGARRALMLGASGPARSCRPRRAGRAAPARQAARRRRAEPARVRRARTCRGPGAGACPRICGPSPSRPGAAGGRPRRVPGQRRGRLLTGLAAPAARPAVPGADRGAARRWTSSGRIASITSCSSGNRRSWLVWGAWILMAYRRAAAALALLPALGGEHRSRGARWPLPSCSWPRPPPATARSCSARPRGATSGRARSLLPQLLVAGAWWPGARAR